MMYSNIGLTYREILPLTSKITRKVTQKWGWYSAVDVGLTVGLVKEGHGQPAQELSQKRATKKLFFRETFGLGWNFSHLYFHI